MYRPKPILNQYIGLRNETVTVLYETERNIIRLDDRIKHSPFAPSVRKTLVRGDGLSVLNADDLFPDIYTVMRLEVAGFLLPPEQDTNEALVDLLKKEKHPTMDLSLQTYRYMQSVEWVTQQQTDATLETPHEMLVLHNHCLKGPAPVTPQNIFRATDSKKSKSGSRKEYEAPSPQDLDGLLVDFCKYVSTNSLCPLAQASIAQFQFEALRPFDAHIDRMERLIMHYILNKRKLVDNITVPINLFAAHFKDRFNDLLLPSLRLENPGSIDLVDSIEILIDDTTNVVTELLRFTISLHKILSTLVDKWKTRLGRVERGSAVEQLLFHFVGTPIMTITQGRECIGKSFSTVSDAFERLEEAGILRQGPSIKRNKTYEAVDAIILHKKMYHPKTTTVEDWINSRL